MKSNLYVLKEMWNLKKEEKKETWWDDTAYIMWEQCQQALYSQT